MDNGSLIMVRLDLTSAALRRYIFWKASLPFCVARFCKMRSHWSLLSNGYLSYRWYLSDKGYLSTKGSLSNKRGLSNEGYLLNKEPVSSKAYLSNNYFSAKGSLSKKEALSSKGYLSNKVVLSNNGCIQSMNMDPGTGSAGTMAMDGPWWIDNGLWVMYNK